jgi:hypothetical protein
MRTLTLLALGGLLLAAPARADDNDAIRKGLKDTEVHSSWVYNDLGKGLALAKKSGKPLLVVFR